MESPVWAISKLPSNLSIKVVPHLPHASDGKPVSQEPCDSESAETDGTFAMEGTMIQLVPYEEGEENRSAEGESSILCFHESVVRCFSRCKSVFSQRTEGTLSTAV